MDLAQALEELAEARAEVREKISNLREGDYIGFGYEKEMLAPAQKKVEAAINTLVDRRVRRILRRLGISTQKKKEKKRG